MGGRTNMIEIYEPPECACCHDRGFRRLPDGTIVCSSCESNILLLNKATNQTYARCISALQAAKFDSFQALNQLGKPGGI